MPDHPDVIIGIDLGTTNSLVAYADAAGPRLLPGPGGDDDVILPSVVDLDDTGQVRSIGADARAHAVERPQTTIHSVKRLMGKGLTDLQDALADLPYTVERHPSDAGRDVAAVRVADRTYTPPQISALILRELKQRAEKHFGHPVTRAVITVPAQFDDSQRQATRDAGQIAGLQVERIVNEPTAAALAYGLDRKETSTIAVYDLGGGTFDVSLLQMDAGVFDVRATHGDTRLGGDDFDQLLINLFTREIRAQFDLELRVPHIQQQLRTLAEQLKMRLSNADDAPIEIDLGNGRVYRRTVTRAEFEALIAPLVERTIAACRKALRAAQLTPAEIDEVIMVGGSTRVPCVRQRVAEVFDCHPYTALNPDHVVALGAAMQGAIIAGIDREMLLLDVTPLSLGIETLGGAMSKLIPANRRIPCQASETFTTFQDGQANVKINVLQGERELAQDCRSLGVFTLAGIPPMPAGMPKIDVAFLIDQNGILNVSAREQRSGKLASVQIVPSHGLTRDEVNRMELESFVHAREDMAAHHLIDVRTTLQFDLNKAQRMLDRFGQLLEEDARGQLQSALTDLQSFAQTSTDPVELNRRREAFNHSTMRLAELAVAASLQAEQD